MNLRSNKRQQGNTLVLTLVMTLTIGTVLASYLGLLGSRYKVTLRSQCWNAAIPVLEAGIEEALTHLQDDPNDLAANGWPVGAIAGQQVYSKQRSFADGSYFLAKFITRPPLLQTRRTSIPPASYLRPSAPTITSPEP